MYTGIGPRPNVGISVSNFGIPGVILRPEKARILIDSSLSNAIVLVPCEIFEPSLDFCEELDTLSCIPTAGSRI